MAINSENKIIFDEVIVLISNVYKFENKFWHPRPETAYW